MSSFSERLRKSRQSKKITQRAMADYLGIISSAYQKYEYGGREPNYSTLMKICECLQVSADWLLGLSDEQAIHSSASAPEVATSESESGDQWEKVFAILKTMARDIARDIAETNTRIDKLYDNSSVTSPATEDEEAVALEMSL